LSRRTAFQDRQIHEYGTDSIDEVEQMQDRLPGLQVFENPVNTFISFVMNPTRPPWDDERIRKAALFALNRQEFVERIVGGAGQPNGLVHWPLGDFALPPGELEQLQPYDPTRSRQLIRDATGEDTIRVSVMYPLGTDIQFHREHLTIFLEQMRDAGFEIDEEPRDFGTWLDRFTSVDYDASLSLNQVYETAETPLNWHSSGGPQGDGNFGIGIGVFYPEVDEAIMESKRVVDFDGQVEAVRAAQRLIYEKGPAFLPIMSWNAFVLRHDFVRNWPVGLGNAGLYLNNWWLDLPAPVPGLLGDVDCSGNVDSGDAAGVLQQHAGRTSWLPCGGSADVNGDGSVNSIDAALILQYEAGVIDSLPP
jgi:ABC-type transport system substrate-binding protein